MLILFFLLSMFVSVNDTLDRTVFLYPKILREYLDYPEFEIQKDTILEYEYNSGYYLSPLLLNGEWAIASVKDTSYMTIERWRSCSRLDEETIIDTIYYPKLFFNYRGHKYKIIIEWEEEL